MGQLPVDISRFTLKNHMMGAHKAVHPFCVNNRLSIPLRVSSQQRPYPSITVRERVSHGHIYPGQHCSIVKTGLSSAILPVRQSVNPDTQLRTRYTNDPADVSYLSSQGNKDACAIHFFAQKALQLADLLIGGSKFKSRHNFLARIHGG